MLSPSDCDESQNRNKAMFVSTRGLTSSKKNAVYNLSGFIQSHLSQPVVTFTANTIKGNMPHKLPMRFSPVFGRHTVNLNHVTLSS